MTQRVKVAVGESKKLFAGDLLGADESGDVVCCEGWKIRRGDA
jgi:hypothetical protein